MKPTSCRRGYHHQALLVDRKISQMVLGDEPVKIHGIVACSMDVDGVNTATVDAARKMRIPVVGTGESDDIFFKCTVEAITCHDGHRVIGNSWCRWYFTGQGHREKCQHHWKQVSTTVMGLLWQYYAIPYCPLGGLVWYDDDGDHSGGSVATTTSSRAYSFTASLAGYWGIPFQPDWTIDVNPVSILGACVPVFIAVMLIAQALPGKPRKGYTSDQMKGISWYH